MNDLNNQSQTVDLQNLPPEMFILIFAHLATNAPQNSFLSYRLVSKMFNQTISNTLAFHNRIFDRIGIPSYFKSESPKLTLESYVIHELIGSKKFNMAFPDDEKAKQVLQVIVNLYDNTIINNKDINQYFHWLKTICHQYFHEDPARIETKFEKHLLTIRGILFALKLQSYQESGPSSPKHEAIDSLIESHQKNDENYFSLVMYQLLIVNDEALLEHLMNEDKIRSSIKSKENKTLVIRAAYFNGNVNYIRAIEQRVLSMAYNSEEIRQFYDCDNLYTHIIGDASRGGIEGLTHFAIINYAHKKYFRQYLEDQNLSKEAIKDFKYRLSKKRLSPLLNQFGFININRLIDEAKNADVVHFLAETLLPSGYSPKLTKDSVEKTLVSNIYPNLATTFYSLLKENKTEKMIAIYRCYKSPSGNLQSIMFNSLLDIIKENLSVTTFKDCFSELYLTADEDGIKQHETLISKNQNDIQSIIYCAYTAKNQEYFNALNDCLELDYPLVEYLPSFKEHCKHRNSLKNISLERLKGLLLYDKNFLNALLYPSRMVSNQRVFFIIDLLSNPDCSKFILFLFCYHVVNKPKLFEPDYGTRLLEFIWTLDVNNNALPAENIASEPVYQLIFPNQEHLDSTQDHCPDFLLSYLDIIKRYNPDLLRHFANDKIRACYQKSLNQPPSEPNFILIDETVEDQTGTRLRLLKSIIQVDEEFLLNSMIKSSFDNHDRPFHDIFKNIYHRFSPAHDVYILLFMLYRLKHDYRISRQQKRHLHFINAVFPRLAINAFKKWLEHDKDITGKLLDNILGMAILSGQTDLIKLLLAQEQVTYNLQTKISILSLKNISRSLTIEKNESTIAGLFLQVKAPDKAFAQYYLTEIYSKLDDEERPDEKKLLNVFGEALKVAEIEHLIGKNTHYAELFSSCFQACFEPPSGKEKARLLEEVSSTVKSTNFNNYLDDKTIYNKQENCQILLAFAIYFQSLDIIEVLLNKFDQDYLKLNGDRYELLLMNLRNQDVKDLATCLKHVYKDNSPINYLAKNYELPMFNQVLNLLPLNEVLLIILTKWKGQTDQQKPLADNDLIKLLMSQLERRDFLELDLNAPLGIPYNVDSIGNCLTHAIDITTLDEKQINYFCDQLTEIYIPSVRSLIKWVKEETNVSDDVKFTVLKKARLACDNDIIFFAADSAIEATYKACLFLHNGHYAVQDKSLLKMFFNKRKQGDYADDQKRKIPRPSKMTDVSSTLFGGTSKRKASPTEGDATKRPEKQRKDHHAGS